MLSTLLFFWTLFKIFFLWFLLIIPVYLIVNIIFFLVPFLNYNLADDISQKIALILLIPSIVIAMRVNISTVRVFLYKLNIAFKKYLFKKSIQRYIKMLENNNIITQYLSKHKNDYLENLNIQALSRYLKEKDNVNYHYPKGIVASSRKA